MTYIAYAAIGAAAILGFILGLWLRPFLSKFPLLKVVEPEEFSGFVEKVANLEIATEQRHLKAKELHDAKRRSWRPDGGKPAKVHKMRRRRTVYREPL